MILPVHYKSTHYTKRKAVREAYVKQQDGLCYHCGAPLSGTPSGKMKCTPINKSIFPTGFFKYPVHLHHSHETGMTLGAVHNRCNAILWQYHGE